MTNTKKVTEEAKVTIEQKKVGNFIVVNYLNVKGMRLNMEHVSSYAPNSEKSIQIAWVGGGSATLPFATPEEMYAVLEKLDDLCV